MWLQVYPIGAPGQNGSAMHTAVSALNASLGRSRPLWQVRNLKTLKPNSLNPKTAVQVVQSFNWAQMGSEGAGLCKHSGQCHTPNLTESRSMAWQAIAGGANGVLFFSYDDLHHNPDVPFEEGWRRLKAVGSEIARFAPALLSARAPEPVVARRPAWLMTRAHWNTTASERAIILFAVSDGNGGGPVTVSVPGVRAVHVVNEPTRRAVAVAGSTFTDSIGPLCVRVYELVLSSTVE